MTRLARRPTAPEAAGSTVPAEGGPALAAVLAAGIGSFAMGLFALLDAVGVFSAPALYGPAGGVSGRTTLAVLVWLASWAVLHWRWRAREIPPGPVVAVTLGLIALGLVGAFPPIWELFG